MMVQKIKNAVLLLLIASSITVVHAQQKQMSMSLEECLTYAKEHSIALQKAEITVENSVVNEKMAKSAFLPNLSGSVGQNLSNVPLKETNNANTYSGNYGVNASMSIYNGGVNSINLRQSKLETKLYNQDVDAIINSLEENITHIYIRMLYATEQIKVNKYSLNVSEKNRLQGVEFFKAGRINSVDLAQFEAAEATDRYNLVVSETYLKEQSIQLKQLLQLDGNIELRTTDIEFTDASLQTPILPLEDVYSVASTTRAEINSSKLNEEITKLDISKAKAGYLPVVQLSGNVGINHISTSNITFNDQLKNSWNNSLGITIKVPIFNNMKTKSTVTKSKNALRTAELNSKEKLQDLYYVIEGYYISAINAQAKYNVASIKLLATEKSLDLVSQKYELGMKDVIELLKEQDNYRIASQDCLESKYTLIMNKTLLNYYKSGQIKIQ